MDREAAFAELQRLASSDDGNLTKKQETVLLVCAFVILKDVLDDFKRVASALEGIAQKSNITYAGPKHFHVVDGVAATTDKE